MSGPRVYAPPPLIPGMAVHWLDPRAGRHGTTYPAVVVRVGPKRVTLDVNYGVKTLRRSVSPDRIFVRSLAGR